MTEQADTLLELVSYFRTSGEGARESAPPPHVARPPVREPARAKPVAKPAAKPAPAPARSHKNGKPDDQDWKEF
jgi:hypothetical protein